ncbi:MAG: cytochrome c-type biogenesis protein CcmH [Thiohalocapsa sp.]|jgi:cytochrome c-type biogenesis protein CcmH|uniref:cytochrome c-type biogenesis protein n=1 Tax=Thiohalocapsa sp. TaxID=2497641 RepID=UPI0025F6FE96|nr:cytochrome c-type biogenesis protein [Thiohalocapsa sp.]MCG6940530.1 cytochrome c-type biogenesis protein CcmH [Thiohalocapsa sp.]
MSPLIKTLLIAAVLLFGTAASAFTLEEFQFDSPAQEQQFRTLIGKLRCLVCQNESLAASQAELAQDLRNEVYRMMRAGKSQSEIIDYLVARYGDFVLYDPPLRPSTYVLWFGPFVIILIAGFFMLRAILNRKPGADDAISDADRERLQALLGADAAGPSATGSLPGGEPKQPT